MLPMDEALCMVAVDLSGRPGLFWQGDINGKVGSFDGEVIKEFFRGFANEARITLHVNLRVRREPAPQDRGDIQGLGKGAAGGGDEGREGEGGPLDERLPVMIAIVDYGMGNLRSVTNAFRRLGAPITITSDATAIREAAGLVLPGVGAFGKCVENLKRLRPLRPHQGSR